jgi:type IVB pilus formation R64 PilN family outer membrane protein
MIDFTGIKTVLKPVAALALIGALGGCATLDAVHHDVAKTRAGIATSRTYTPHAAPVVSDSIQPYLAGRQIHRHIVSLPAAFKRKLTFISAKKLSLVEVASKITDLTGIPVAVAHGAQGALVSQGAGGGGGRARRTRGNLPPVVKNNPQDYGMRVNWSGSLKGLLDAVAARAGVFWEYLSDTDTVRFFLSETRIFHVAAVAGQTSSNESIASSGSGANGSASNSLQTGQKVTNTVKQDRYKAISADIKAILAPYQGIGSGAAGQRVLKVNTAVAVNPAANTVAVSAPPPALRAVAKYIDTLNQQLTRQALITVHVYQVTLKREANYGLNLNAAFKAAGEGFTLGSPSIPAINATGTDAGQLAATILKGGWNGSKAIVQALSTQGKVALIRTASVVALNNQPAPLHVGNQITYLASASTTLSANVGATTSLQTAQLSTGFAATFTPSITDNGRHILLSYAINLASLVDLTTIKSGNAEVQTPNLATQAFMQTARLTDGETLLLSGFERTEAQSSKNGIGTPDNFALGGGLDANHNHQILVVAIKVESLD